MNSLNILLIDDEPTTRKMLQRLLERDGHFVTAVDNGLEGIDTFKIALTQQKPFDLVITDYGMPRMNGGQVAKNIKALSPSTPVIMVSGWDSASSIEDSTLSVVDSLINKPVSMRELRAAIEKAMKRRRTGI